MQIRGFPSGPARVTREKIGHRAGARPRLAKLRYGRTGALRRSSDTIPPPTFSIVLYSEIASLAKIWEAADSHPLGQVNAHQNREFYGCQRQLNNTRPATMVLPRVTQKAIWERTKAVQGTRATESYSWDGASNRLRCWDESV